MLNKRNLLGLGVLLIVLVLGIGYAVVTTVDIKFKGNIRVKDSNVKVYIDSYVEKTDKAIVEHNIKNDNKTAEFTISNMKVNEDVILSYTIANKEEDLKVYLEENSQITNSNPEFFDVTYKVVGNQILGNIGSGSETSVIDLIIKLKKTPITEEESSATISFTIKANPIS